MDRILVQPSSNIELLMQLGLTLNEAKVFLTLSEIGTATAKAISSKSGIAREFIYQMLPTLHKKGIIEEVLTSPKTFKALPMENAYTILLEHIEKENKELKIKVKEDLKNHRNTPLIQSGDFQTVSLPSGKATGLRFFQEFKKADKSINMIIPLEKFMRISLNNDDNVLEGTNRLEKKNIPFQIITEAPSQEMIKKHKFLTPNQKNKLRFIEHSPQFTLVEISIIDEKKLLVATSRNNQLEKMTWLFSNNPFIVELANSYFKKLWETLPEKAS